MTRQLGKIVLLLALCLISPLSPLAFHPSSVNGQAAQPEYAKWGIVAMEATKAKYGIPIVDYRHIGRVATAPGTAEERFKLWLKDGNREFGVIVSVQFDTGSERLIAVKFRETDRPTFRRT